MTKVTRLFHLKKLIAYTDRIVMSDNGIKVSYPDGRFFTVNPTDGEIVNFYDKEGKETTPDQAGADRIIRNLDTQHKRAIGHYKRGGYRDK